MTDRAKPTPGPLTLAATPNGAVEVCSGINTVAEFIWSGQYTNPMISRDEALANASRLMASEDMLTALLWLKPYAELQVRKYPDGEDIGGWRMVLAAIERATGGGA